MTHELKEPCGGECKMTWKMYESMTLGNGRDIVATICHGVYEHPHLSNDLYVDRYGTPFDYPIHWIVGDMYTDYKAPHGKTRMDVLKHIIENGADVNVKESITHYTPLLNTFDVDIFEYLVSHGANIDDCDSKGNNILHHCVQVGGMRHIKNIWHIPGVAALARERNKMEKTPLDLVNTWQHKQFSEIVTLLKESCAIGRFTKRAI